MSIQKILALEENKNIKFASASFEEKENECVLIFLYPDNEQKPSAEQKKKITSEVKNLLKDVCKVKVKFKPSYIDNEVLFNELIDFFEHNLPVLQHTFKLDDVTFNKNESQLKIIINCRESEKRILTENTNYKSLMNYFSVRFFENIEFEFNVCKTEKKLREQDYEDISPNADLMRCIEKEQEINVVAVDNVENLMGKLITKPPVFIENMGIEEKEEVVLAGFFSNPIESEFIPKSKREKGEMTTKKKFSFTLTDATGSIEVVCFPNDKNLEILRKLEDQQQVLINGYVSTFGNKASIRINALSKCNILTLERQYVWREEKPEYICVSPKPMVDLVQMDLFNKEIAKNDNFWNEHKSVVVFDFETTGLQADTCHIIEIGAVKVVNGVCTETFSTLINPGCAIPEEIQKITNITPDMIAFAPTIDNVLPDFYKFVKGSVLSAYNIGFDIKFLQNAGKKYRYNFDNVQIDTLELARNKIPSLHNYKLSTVVKALNIVLEDAHRALNDAVATAKVFIKLI
ncbi:MAG: 3'-5' exoribonuclease [Clostridia bacterium]|nr:3'-5' exoribonuclease [Clostridia bacterium]